jgi:Fic-DOC domain mobile mystery protein B
LTDLYEYPNGATPLDPDEIEGLIPTHIVNREQLNLQEQENILAAQLWLASARMSKINIEADLRKLHKNMFGKVWRWAGTFRLTGKNIGVEAYQIVVELKNLCDDVDAWIENKSYPADELAARFHHKLVKIHAFPNGNGRHARLATDVLLTKQLGKKAFTWGSASIEKEGEICIKYIEALRRADKEDYRALFEFVRS